MDPSILTAQIVGIEWIIVLIVLAALFLFGPKKIPEMAHGLGRALGEFKRGRAEIEKEISQMGDTAKDDLTVELEK
jgi:sec-independent protein translocase protein TatA